MKKVFAILLAVAVLLSMAACGDTGEQQQVSYKASTDIEVALAFVDGNARVVTRKLTDKALKAIDLVCVYYSINGYQQDEYEIVGCEFSSENELSIWTFDVPIGTAYMDAAIASVTYADGTKEECPGVSTWASTTSALFSVETYQKRVDDMKKLQGAAAENCPAAKTTVSAVTEGKLPIEITNTGDKDISKMVLYVLWFDEAGMPVACNGPVVSNSENISSGELTAGETANYTVDPPETAVNAKALVKSITFADETTWENEYVYEWSFVNYKFFEK